MRANRRRRLFLIVFMLTGVGISLGMVLYALRNNISLYYTPSQLQHIKLSKQQVIRIGGLVAQHSVHWSSHSLKVNFALIDSHQKIWITYHGLLPSLFREGQGVVVQGYLEPNGVFHANQVLAKHDANYHPPGLQQ